jgi:predicted DNA-binding ribbon-helix-helix protein
MADAPVKRSLRLHGHQTSVSLEAPFWRAFRDLAARRGQSLNACAAAIDAGRTGTAGLATAIRLAVLEDLEHRLAAQAGGPSDP